MYAAFLLPIHAWRMYASFTALLVNLRVLKPMHLQVILPVICRSLLQPACSQLYFPWKRPKPPVAYFNYSCQIFSYPRQTDWMDLFLPSLSGDNLIVFLDIFSYFYLDEFSCLFRLVLIRSCFSGIKTNSSNMVVLQDKSITSLIQQYYLCSYKAKILRR